MSSIPYKDYSTNLNFLLALSLNMPFRMVEGLLYLFVHGFLIDANYCGRLAVGDSLLLKEK